MSYLIDTNVLSEIRKTQRRNPNVSAWLESVRADELFVSVLSLGEIRRGVEILLKRDPVSARNLDHWLAGLETHYSDRIIPITPAIADRWGRLCPDQPLPVSDGLIAATGIEHRLTIVTRNTNDFLRSGANSLNPFLPRNARAS